jgi:hypothetical protein
MKGQRTRWAMTLIVLAALVAVPTGADINSFKGGVRVAAGSCVTYPVTAGATIMTATGDLAISNQTQRVDVRMVCHLPVPEGSVIRQFAMVGKVSIGEVFATLSVVEPTDPGQAPFFATLTLTPSTPFEIPGKQQKVVAELPASGGESLKVQRTRAHYIDATFKSPAAVSAAQALRVFYFEVYWN